MLGLGYGFGQMIDRPRDVLLALAGRAGSVSAASDGAGLLDVELVPSSGMLGLGSLGLFRGDFRNALFWLGVVFVLLLIGMSGVRNT
jgi:hypothetical protein